MKPSSTRTNRIRIQSNNDDLAIHLLHHFMRLGGNYLVVNELKPTETPNVTCVSCGGLTQMIWTDAMRMRGKKMHFGQSRSHFICTSARLCVELHLTGIVCVLLSRSTDSDSWAPHTIVFGGSFTRQSEGEKTELLIEKKAKQFFLLPNRKTNPVVTRD